MCVLTIIRILLMLDELKNKLMEIGVIEIYCWTRKWEEPGRIMRRMGQVGGQ